MAPLRTPIIATLLLLTALLLVELLYVYHNNARSYIIPSVFLPQSTNPGINYVINLAKSTITDTLPTIPLASFDILNATKNETLGFSKIFYISLPQ